MIRTKWILFLVITISVWGCRDRQSEIPFVQVNLSLNLNEPQFFDLSVPTGYAYVIGGSQGIIIYRLNAEEFVALERHSPYEPGERCQVIVNEDGVIVEDPCSGSQWLINDGSIVNGPTPFALRQYETSYNPPFLYVFN